MKSKQLFLAMSVSLIALFSCDNNKKDTNTTVSTDTVSTATAPAAQQSTRQGTATVVTTENVPQPVRTSFTTKYPKIEKVEWYTYAPVPEDEFVMDDQYYYVRFNDNGEDYMSWYNNRGEWVKTSTKIEGNKNLPDAVNQYINTNYEGYTIEEIHKENDKNTDLYEIKLNKGDSKLTIKILPNGELVKRKTK